MCHKTLIRNISLTEYIVSGFTIIAGMIIGFEVFFVEILAKSGSVLATSINQILYFSHIEHE
jgi:hypothetical protein